MRSNRRPSKNRGSTAASRSRGFKDWMYRSGCPVYCAHCMRPVKRDKATVDHIVPWWAGGNDWTWNFLISCESCNKARARDDMIHWGGHHNPHCMTGGKCLCAPAFLRGNPSLGARALYKDIKMYLGLVKYIKKRWQIPAQP